MVKTMFYIDPKDRQCFGVIYPNPGWYSKEMELPESKITTIETSDKKHTDVTVTSVFKDSVKGRVPALPNDYNNQFTITVKNGNTEESFVYGISIHDTKTKNPKIVLTDHDHIYAFYCFLNDAISGSTTFKEFQSEYGYSDCCEAYKIWKACQESALKFLRLGLGDMYEISNFIREKYPEVI